MWMTDEDLRRFHRITFDHAHRSPVAGPRGEFTHASPACRSIRRQLGVAPQKAESEAAYCSLCVTELNFALMSRGDVQEPSPNCSYVSDGLVRSSDWPVCWSRADEPSGSLDFMAKTGVGKMAAAGLRPANSTKTLASDVEDSSSLTVPHSTIKNR
ncbi:hypothetical protein PsYK624_163540 [Phanerochaete sordida]|uniref:Uncharacterized protein n=1 Tax=Phanerochaete sordida TaxID=48140 RepID=A0A9P3LM58_9APHY|nr:hypothetical protein PsYK624_163540 [Phanerochaete sordida]